MNDPHLFDRPARASFADRLEDDFLRAAGVGTGHGTTTTPAGGATAGHTSEETTMTVELDTPSPSTRPRTRLIWMVTAAAAVVALVVTLIALSSRSKVETPSTTPDTVASGQAVRFTVTWEYSDIESDCSGPAECLNHFAYPARTTFTGDIDGHGLQALFWNGPEDYPDRVVDHLEHVGTYSVRADVAGCGSGEFLLVEVMQFVSGPDHDRETGTYKGTWQIVPQSGRNSLRTISGSGTSDGSFALAQDAGRTFTGTISCGNGG